MILIGVNTVPLVFKDNLLPFLYKIKTSIRPDANVINSKGRKTHTVIFFHLAINFLSFPAVKVVYIKDFVRVIMDGVIVILCRC